MTIEEIKEIIQLLTESGVAEIEVQRGENRVWIKRASVSQEVQLPPPQLPPPASPIQPPPPASYPGPAAQPPVPPPAPDTNVPIIKAPIVGTFYESPSPGSPAFVKVGDTVQAGQVLCIIESMKLMNEIEAEAPGVILSKLVPNGKPVEYGEALFTYRPL
ncbi:MAG: Biotin carboxyl carrier protein of acetyl-CoA carboxylase [Bryobacteraceae bacterium]|nr:Biotin carboxyl carrier protein of acetyl-CoA carboxylase [Bryobacteraceae bacterium]